MKTNKLSLIAVVALGGVIAFGTLAKAEDKPEAKAPGKHEGKPPGGPGGQERGAKMAEELGLSAEQKTQMGDLSKEFGPKMKAIHEDTTLSKEDKMAKMKALNEERTAKIKGILTPDQFEKWQKAQHNRRGPGGPGGPRGEGKPPGDKPEKKD